MPLRLVQPDVRYSSSYEAALREFLHEAAHPAAIHKALSDLPAAIDYLLALDITPPRGAVPQRALWLVAENEYIGSIYVRRVAAGRLPSTESHIYYEVRPSKRRQGYGTILLRLGLQEAARLGLGSVVLACYASNIASRKIIERNGGVLTDQARAHGNATDEILRYRIDLLPAEAMGRLAA